MAVTPPSNVMPLHSHPPRSTQTPPRHGPKKMFVLDTNVLLRPDQPVPLEEHDIFPMISTPSWTPTKRA